MKQLIEAARAATFDDWLKAHYIKCGFISSTTELRLAWDAALAAAPAQVPLTDEQIQAAWDSIDMRYPRGNATRNAFARAIERAHGIGVLK